jgi:hypothetical protein
MESSPAVNANTPLRQFSRKGWAQAQCLLSEEQLSVRARFCNKNKSGLKNKSGANVFLGPNPLGVRRGIDKLVDDNRSLQVIFEEVLNRSKIHGIVTEHLKDAVVVRFNVEGETEEREFFWKDLNATPDNVPVGALVVGETRLLRASSPATAEEVQAEMERIEQDVAREIHRWGVDAKTMIGSEPDEELKRKSTVAWAANQQNP